MSLMSELAELTKKGIIVRKGGLVEGGGGEEGHCIPTRGTKGGHTSPICLLLRLLVGEAIRLLLASMKGTPLPCTRPDVTYCTSVNEVNGVRDSLDFGVKGGL